VPIRRSFATAVAFFLDELKATIPIRPVTEATAEIAARVGGLADLLISACALELGYAVVTSNLRDFGRVPGLTVRQI
jgi:predicted nucleic acid-binding protein